EAVDPRWAQVVDVEILRKVTEWLLPGLACPCCGTVTFAKPPPGLHAGSVSYGPVLNAAAFDDAMIAALAAEDVLAADETPVNVLDKSLSRPRRRKRRGEAGPEETDGRTGGGGPDVLIVRTP